VSFSIGFLRLLIMLRSRYQSDERDFFAQVIATLVGAVAR
jgi:hypothetical protein